MNYFPSFTILSIQTKNLAMYRAIANTIMALKITKKMKICSLPYTRKEILEQEHTDLWNRAEAAVNRLIDLQQKLVMGLPDSKQGVPTDIEMLENKDVQLGYLKHLHLISLYGLEFRIHSTTKLNWELLL